MLCREKSKSVVLSRLPRNAESEFAFLSAAFITCAYVGTNRAGLQKIPVTLRDNTNGSDVRVTYTLCVVRASRFGAATDSNARYLL